MSLHKANRLVICHNVSSSYIMQDCIFEMARQYDTRNGYTIKTVNFFKALNWN